MLSTLDLITIASQGNAIDYGNLTTATADSAGVSNSVKGFSAGGQAPGNTNTIETFNISTGGTATDFGDLTSQKAYMPANSAAHGGLNDGYQGTRPIPFQEAGGDRGIIAGVKLLEN